MGAGVGKQLISQTQFLAPCQFPQLGYELGRHIRQFVQVFLGIK
jgi:hypothetical protein